VSYVLDHLTTSVEDITEYYRQQGICSGESCVRFMEQVSWSCCLSCIILVISILFVVMTRMLLIYMSLPNLTFSRGCAVRLREIYLLGFI